MGWLRDLMRRAEPQVRSYGELARAVLASSHWTEDPKPQPRSLAALFSKLDRNIELEWLADRRPTQQALAEALSCPVARVRREVEAHLGHLDERSTVWRVEGVRYARPLELAREPLPPGLPGRLSEPYGWGGLLWLNASAAQIRLTRAWLSARGAAHCFTASNWSDASAQLPTAGPVLIEMLSGFDLSQLPEQPPRAGLCLAASTSDYEFRKTPERLDWEFVNAGPIEQWLSNLLEWLEKRLPADGHFERATAEKWLTEEARAGAVTDLESALGLAGLLDELGVEQVHGKDSRALARRYVDQRLHEASRDGNADAQWLLHAGFDVLVGLLVRSLTDFDEAPSPRHTHDEWMRLVPAELQKSIDTEWVRISLAKSGARTTVRDLEKALGEMPPGAYRVIRALVSGGLLVESDPDGLDPEPRYEMAPVWLFNAALASALEALCRSAPFEWGEAMFNHAIAPRIVETLGQALSEEKFDFLDELVDLDAASSPAETVAVETGFRLLGLGLLGDLEPSPEYVEGIWQLQAQLWIELPDSAPVPRFVAPEPFARRCPPTSLGAWYLAAWALSEHLPSAQQKPFNLAPWSLPTGKLRSPELAALRNVCETIYRFLAASDDDMQRAAGFALASRLGSSFAELVGTDVSLLVPHLVVDGVLNDNLNWTQVKNLLADSTLVEATSRLCEQHKLPWSRVARRVWQAWIDASRPQLGAEALSPSSNVAAALWPSIPPTLLESWSSSPWAKQPLPYAQLSEQHWEVLLPQWNEIRDLAPATEFWTHVPGKFALEALEAGILGPRDRAALKLLWQRFPDAVIDSLQHWIGKSDLDRAGQLLDTAPESSTEHLATLLRESTLTHRARSELQLTAVRWCRSRLWRRGPNWRAAYDLLADIEDRRRRFPRR